MSTRTLTRSTGLMPSVFEDFFRPWNDLFETTNSGLFGRVLTIPAVNITENKDDFKVSLAAPGMKKNDFNIDVQGNILTISAEREEKKEEKEEDYTRKEYNFSSFSRSFTLPDEVNKEKIEATYVDGVLNLSLPKKEEAKKAAISKHVAVK
jgi:HSP20 family protein